jgi:cytidylate kinase
VNDNKKKQADLLEQMQDHSEADKDFYLVANMVMNLAKRARDIFESSEPEEKNELLKYLLQNCELDGRNLVYKLKAPYQTMLLASNHSDWLRIVEEVRTIIQEQKGMFTHPI